MHQDPCVTPACTVELVDPQPVAEPQDPLEQALVEDFEERTALMEYDGGLPRAEAETVAWQSVREEPDTHD
jgi:hypothetical protein